MYFSATCQNALCCILWDLNKCRNPLNIMFLNMSIKLNETTMVPQNTAIWQSRSHPHDSTFSQKHFIFLLWHCLYTSTRPTKIFNGIYSNHNFETFLCFCSILLKLHPSIYSIKAFPSDFIYESNTVLRISEYTLSTQELSQSLKNTYFSISFLSPSS